jgi:hypothetical protein
MKKLLPFKMWLAFFLFIFTSLVFSKELPNILELKYELTQNGEFLGTVVEKFITNETGKYRIESVTKGIGLYALFGDRILMSEGIISQEGLKPRHFEVHQGNNRSKDAIVDFDWENQILTTRYKGAEIKENIENKTQDLISYLYQLNFENFNDSMIEFTAATGKKYKKYQFKIVDKQAMLLLGDTNFETIFMQSVAEKDGKPETQIWLNNKLYKLPIRIRYQEKNGSTLEQNLVQANIDLNGL